MILPRFLADLSAVDAAAVVAGTLAAGLGLYIGYQAFRGLRRNDSRSMRYLSIGMILLFGVTYATAFVGQALISFRVVPIRTQDAFRLVVRLLQVTGLGFIAYSLRIAGRE